MKKKLLFVIKSQFGYHLDTYKYCMYLKNSWDITYICFDNGKIKRNAEGLNIIYISNKSNFFLRAIHFYVNIIKEIYYNDYSLIFINYFNPCFIIKLLFWRKKFILDIRSGSVTKNKYKNRLNNYLIKFNSLFFKNISIISKSLANYLKINNYTVVPVGAEQISTNNKNFNKFELLYIGTLVNRRIEETIQGLYLFMNMVKSSSIKYHIFGSGESEKYQLLKIINKLTLQDNVIYHGYKTHDEMQEFFDKCNVGISYIPITNYYNYQPPTKTFEYILSGMVCVATNTPENQRIINGENGILCKDNSQSFANALNEVYKKRKSYDSYNIRLTMKHYEWKNIIYNIFEPFIQMVIAEN